MAMYGEGKTRGQISELQIAAATNQACAAIQPIMSETKDYIKLFFESHYLHIRRLAEGGLQPNLNLNKISECQIPIPPIQEQYRIVQAVARFDEFIKYIEASKVSLYDYVEKAKSKILSLAITGRLVPQNPADEPASELLKRINPKAEIVTDKGQHRKLPSGWCYTTLNSVGRWKSGATPSKMHKEYYLNGNIPWLRTGDLNDGIIDAVPMFITKLALDNSSVTLNPKGSVLIAMYGATIGKVGILNIEATTNQACCACVRNDAIYNKFLFYFLLAKRQYFIESGGGGAQSNISKEIILSTEIELPPLAEQFRIVSQVELLFSVCNSIKNSLEA